ncbi:DUF3310 domain-containing protein [Zhongshania sp.]|jgi:hypothetical protein|uniref:DUF3310 domain-containing protein n=1 Tax=Zhongshania sp. TaxID=1971902 RepID=UPI002A7FAED4|nr:DUF3310 domain-containing protein [Zhongshania sp.]
MQANSAWSTQVGGRHYKDAKIQPAEFWLANQLPGAESEVIKYVYRWRGKNGVQDLKKSRHFIQLMIDAYFGPAAFASPRVASADFQWVITPARFCKENGLDAAASLVIGLICHCESEQALITAIKTINLMIDHAMGEGVPDLDLAQVPANKDATLRAQQAIYIAINRLEDFNQVLSDPATLDDSYREYERDKLGRTLNFLRAEARA